MSTEYQKALGRKIAQYRRRRGLSQREFAALINRSEAWVSQVERGVRKVDRMSVLAAVAEVLDVPVAELAAEAPIVAATAKETPDSTRLRLVLSAAHALNALLAQKQPADLAELRPRVEQAWQLTHKGHYLELTDLLESLVPQLETAARSVDDEQRTECFRLLASVYQACSSALSKLGDFAAAWVAAERAIVAAERADDPLLMAAGEFRLCVTFQGAKHFHQVDTVARTSIEALSSLASNDRPEVLSLMGALTLQRAIAAARSNDATAAYTHLISARSLAQQLGADRNDFHTEFGPTNVSLHEVSVAVDLGDAGIALRAAATVDASDLSAERRGRFLIDVARAHLQRRNLDKAIHTLYQAESITPEQVHSHPLARQAIGDLLTIQDPASPALQELARRAGML